jgi:hypothetical protein
MLHSSRFAGGGTVTFRVLGGKNGKIAAKKWQETARWAAKAATFGADVEVHMPLRAWLDVGKMGEFAPVCDC